MPPNQENVDGENGPSQQPRNSSGHSNVGEGETSGIPQQPAIVRERAPPTEWKSWKLKWPLMIFMVLIEIGLIASIIYLERRSAGSNGIVSVPQFSTSLVSSGFFSSKVWKYGLLWTTFPSLVMTIYRIMWDTIVSGTSDRQPFVELGRLRGNAATARVTIMLDYRSYPSFISWAKALGNGHFTLGASMFLNLLFLVVIVPLTAHLFVAAPSQSISTVILNYPTFFNQSALTATSSLQSSIDLATATRVYRANPPSWMTLEYAIEPFELNTSTTSGNVTANGTAYSAYLDCQEYSASESSAKYGFDSTGGSVTYQLDDRGCQISGFISVQNTTRTYALSRNFQCSGSDYGRLVVFAGLYSDASDIKIANYSLVSCKPSYWVTSGSITVSLQPNASPQFVSFTSTNSTLIHPLLYQILEDTLHSYTFFDPSNSISADAFGFSIFSYAQNQNAASPMTPDLIKNSTEDLFTTLYAGLATNLLLQQSPNPQTANGQLSLPVTRLYVVNPVAYVIVAVLCLILICNVLLFIYSTTKHSILLEEPIGLLGSAALLDRSDVSQLVSDFRQGHAEEYELRKYIDENYTVAGSKCYLERGTRRIRLEDLVERVGR